MLSAALSTCPADVAAASCSTAVALLAVTPPTAPPLSMSPSGPSAGMTRTPITRGSCSIASLARAGTEPSTSMTV